MVPEMGDSVFSLVVDGKNLGDASGVDVPTLLAKVASETVEFAILKEEPGGSFVQAAGAYGLVTVECQHSTPEGRQHYRVCRGQLGDSGEVRRPPLVAGYQGYLEKELLPATDAVDVFTSFMATKTVPERFEVIDITEELGL